MMPVLPARQKRQKVLPGRERRRRSRFWYNGVNMYMIATSKWQRRDEMLTDPREQK